MKFKVGDRVIWVDPARAGIKKGDTAIVVWAQDGSLIRVRWTGVPQRREVGESWYPSRFDLDPAFEIIDQESLTKSYTID